MPTQQHHHNGSTTLRWIIGIIATVLLVGGSSISATLFNHEGRIVANTTHNVTNIKRLERIEQKLDDIWTHIVGANP